MISRLNIASKLLVLIGVLLAAMMLVGGYGLHSLADQQQRAGDGSLRQRQLAGAVDAARAAEIAFKVQVQEWKNLLLRGHEAGDHATYLAAFRARSTAMENDLDAVALGMKAVGLPVTPVDEVRRLHAQLGQHYAEALRSFEPGKLESTQLADRAVRGQDRPIDQKLEGLVSSLQAFAASENARLAAEAQARSRSVSLLMGAVMAAVLLAGTAFGLWIARGISRPLREAAAAARRVADGDLTVSLQVRSRDEVGELLRSLSDMSANLRAVLAEVVSGAHAVADSSSQIAQGNLDLSQRTEEQASTLEETASQMEELTSTVTQNAGNAQQARQNAASAAAVARNGGAVVGQVVETMSAISASSRRIQDIIGVIDGIAFQTNILALNAAVEAARAGEQGRGFAVVAGEVRNLAQRSAAAAREIKDLIGDSVSNVEEGTRQADAAGRTMADIVASVNQVSGLIAEIAAASAEQGAGIEQVNTAVTQMDQVVQQNASLVEDATAATESMKAQAQSLLQMVSRFQLHEGRAPATPLRVAPMAPRPAAKPQALAAKGPLRLAPARGAGDSWQEF